MKLIKNFDFKSLLSLIVILSYIAMVFFKIENEFKDIVLMIITFYFASKSIKKDSE